jgi:carbon starvation protein
MNALLILVVVSLAFLVAFRGYGGFLGRLFGIDGARPTPAVSRCDGTDFVPARHWLMLFGHHFSSICGAGPIVGPVLAVAYWGWAPSLVWIVVGSILMGAVADYSSLVVSMRSDGQGISEIAQPEISPRARLFFSLFIWLSLILIIAVFALFAAKTFAKEPGAVLPSWGLIPVALCTGWLLYRKKCNAPLVTTLGLAALIGLLVLGTTTPLVMPSLAGLSGEQAWIILLLGYCLVASVVPVQVLLQPRDFLAAFLLFATIAIAVLGVAILHPPMAGAPFEAWQPTAAWPAAGPLFPMLFVTIACGAISGFHSLVSSGTTSKQIASETHACRIGYGGMLTEGFVGVLVVICVAAGISRETLWAALKSGGPIAAFSEGYGALAAPMFGAYGKAFAILALNAFILTTLDSATRIARYLTMDLFRVRDKYVATGIVVVAAGGLAMTGQWQRIWPAFGTANQLIAGLALLVSSCWLLRRGRLALPTLIPALIMLVITTAAFTYQLIAALTAQIPNYGVAATAGILLILSGVIVWETILSWRAPRASRAGLDFLRQSR